MTVQRRRALVAGVLAGTLSLGGAVYSQSMRSSAALLSASNPASVLPIPREFQPSGSKVPALPSLLTAQQRDWLRRALWRNPLDQKLVNVLYVDAVRTERQGGTTLATVRTLGRLGWRYTAAQQNLMLRAAMDGHFAEVIDRADGLLRRQKLMDQAISMLVTMEAIPQVHGLVVEKLLGDPMWRHAYLLRIGPQAPAQILDARFHTMEVLLRSPGSVSREELAPTLQALTATGRAGAAYDLWILKAGRTEGDNLVRDARFWNAASLAGDETAIPFEWHMNQSLGYSADASAEGTTINWDGRGVPVFMSQAVPVKPGRRYLLTVQGHADNGKLRDLLAPSLSCGTGSVSFTPAEAVGALSRFHSGLVPTACNMATLTIGGRVDTGTRAVTMSIRQVGLQPE